MFEKIGSREYIGIFLALAVLTLLLAAGFRTQDLLLAGLTLGLYGLHLMSIRTIQEKQERQSSLLREVGGALDDLSVDEGARERPRDGGTEPAEAAASSATRSRPPGSASARSRSTGTPESGGPEPPDDGGLMVPRDLRIGTVAIVQGVLEPSDVSRVMSMQERRPEKPFGELAVEAGLMEPGQVEKLLEVQETGLYSRRKLKQAKSKLRTFLGQDD